MSGNYTSWGWAKASSTHRAAALLLVAVLAIIALPQGAEAATPLRVKVAVVRQADAHTFIVTARTAKRATCGLLVRAPGSSQALPFLRADARGRAGWRWSATSEAPKGRWRFAVRCTKNGDAELRQVRRRLSRGSDRGTVGEPSSFRVVHGKIKRPGGAGRGQGEPAPGVGPFDWHQCTWWAWVKRADVYDTAVASGVPAGGPRGTVEGETVYAWDGSQWFSNAQRAGLPTGQTPVPGALVSFDAYPGNPYGHVAYVEAVQSDAWILISECDGFTLVCGQRWMNPHQAKGRLVGYVYGGPAGSGPTPPPPPPPPPPKEFTLTVYNKVTNGPNEMREDDAPAYLSTRPENYCRQNGCLIPGTERGTGGTLGPVVCQVEATRTTNGEDEDPADDQNPGLHTSHKWYAVRMSDGSLGYISEVWADPSQRGGNGVPSC
jgi:surface antigen